MIDTFHGMFFFLRTSRINRNVLSRQELRLRICTAALCCFSTSEFVLMHFIVKMKLKSSHYIFLKKSLLGNLVASVIVASEIFKN